MKTEAYIIDITKEDIEHRSEPNFRVVLSAYPGRPVLGRSYAVL